MRLTSILREKENEEFSKLTLEGEVLDLGGIKNAKYLSLVQGDFTVTAVNLDEDNKCDVIHDLENTPLPFKYESYDAVVMNNTLEHIYHARELVEESARVLRKGGKLVITVPFLFPVHPSPSDYWRFTKESLEKMLEDAGIEENDIKPLGTGVATVSHLFFERLLPRPFQILGRLLRPIAYLSDMVLYSLRRRGTKEKREYYTLGYFVVGKK